MTRPVWRHGTRTGYTLHHCRCEECVEANREYMRDYYRISRDYYPIIPDVPSDRAAVHIRALQAERMGYREIARHAGVSVQTVRRVALDRRPRGVRPDTERRILAVLPDPYWQPALGTVRRIRALAALGHSQDVIAQHSGVTRRTVGAIMAGGQPEVYSHTAASVRRAYDELSMTLGTSILARQRAAAKGWAPPLAWDDESIDDPQVLPVVAKGQESALDRLEEWLYLVRGGEDLERAAVRVGWKSLASPERLAEREGRADVLDLIHPRRIA